MHPELRLIEDFLTDRGVLDAARRCRACCSWCAAPLTIGQRVLGQGEALFRRGMLTAHAEGTGATLWRLELSDPRQPAAGSTDQAALDTRISSRSRSNTMPEGESALARRQRGVSARRLRVSASPPGAGHPLPDRGHDPHRYQGRQSHTYEIGEPWFESGPEPVFAQAGDRPTRFVRVMILPRALIGKSSIQYVNEEDKTKPKTQQYRVFVDAPLTRPLISTAAAKAGSSQQRLVPAFAG